jgi:LytS/YehU family sensor histidine kinase
MLLAIEVGTQFFRHWKASLVEIEKYKGESAQAQLQNLKNQMNPHFLFNNLSVLNSLVHINADKASEFIQELSRVYRYVLDKRNTELVSLQEELEFIHHYFFLLKIRFDHNLIVEEQIDASLHALLLPPMCLQPLIENCIQHNEVSMAKPLTIRLFTEGEYLVIQNTLQKRLHEEPSTHFGLKNIKARYSFFTSKEIFIQTEEQTFTVKLPLLATV